jgi:hypothetical protein
MRTLFTFSPAYRGPIDLALAQHFTVLLLTAFLLDGGQMFRSWLFAVAAHWIVILMVMFRRRSSPTPSDLWVIRVGFLPVAVLAAVITELLGRQV